VVPVIYTVKPGKSSEKTGSSNFFDIPLSKKRIGAADIFPVRAKIHLKE